MVFTCLVVLTVSAGAHGDGSILFNGTTSKLENGAANVLDGSNEITVCVWVKAKTFTGSNPRLVFCLPADAGQLHLNHHTSANTMGWSAFLGGSATWTFPIKDGAWQAISVVYNRSHMDNNPTVRVNFAEVTEPDVSPTGSPGAVLNGYCVGKASNQNNGWDGWIAHLQVFNRPLSATEQDACLREPGSVTNGLRLWLPMTHGTDIDDCSVNRFHGTATELATGANGPAIFTHPHGAPAGIVLLTPGTLPVTQFEIARFADGTDHPAGKLRGIGPASVLRASSSTGSLPAGSNAVVITEDYEHPNNIDYWQAGALGFPVTGTITGATNAEPIVITSTNHGLATGQIVTITGVVGNEAANDTWTITRIDPNTFSLNDSEGSGMYMSGGMWSFDQLPAVLRAMLRDLTIAGHPDTALDDYSDRAIIDSEPAVHHKITGRVNLISGMTTITVASVGHTLSDGDTVKISGLTGYTLSGGEGPYPVDVISPDTFTLTGPMGSGTHTPNTGVWTSNDSWPDREHGAFVKSSGVTVEGVTFFYIRHV
jgi:hypothetical protein